MARLGAASPIAPTLCHHARCFGKLSCLGCRRFKEFDATRFQIPINAVTVHVRSRDFHDRSLSRGQKLSRRASEERGCKTCLILRRVFLASQPRFLFQIEPDFHLLTQLFAAAQKIDFVFSRQSRNLSMGALEACASSPSRVNGKTRQATHRKNPPYSLPRSTQRCCCSSLLVENSAAHDRRP